ncbi:MAG: hypothetical protein JNK82_27460, partial [Myxococcaceae bacterium]|nr:hypothetical protein [Myxococcaceae bacterium]
MQNLTAALLLLVGCSDYTVCEAVNAEQLGAAPPHLSQTGIDAGVAYEVRYALYSDGATKQRSIVL